MELWNSLVFGLLDPLLGWLLRLSPTAALVVVGIGTSLALTLARKWTTNQDQLRRAASDSKALKQHIRDAKKRGDKAAVQRHRTTLAQIGILKLRSEAKPLLLSLLPIVLLATWAFHRFEFLPPQPGEKIELIASAPLSAAGGVIHLVPEQGLEIEEGWVRKLAADPAAGESQAVWRIDPPPGKLLVRFNGETAEAAPGDLQAADAPIRIAFRGREFRPFGFVPGIPQIGLAAWLVAYLAIVIPFVVLLKKALRIF